MHTNSQFIQLLCQALSLQHVPQYSQIAKQEKGFIYLGDGSARIKSLAGLAYDLVRSGNESFIKIGSPIVLAMAMNLARAMREEIATRRVFINQAGAIFVRHDEEQQWLIHDQKEHVLNTWACSLAEILLGHSRLKVKSTTGELPPAAAGKFIARILDKQTLQANNLLMQVVESSKAMVKDPTLGPWADKAHAIPLSALRTIVGECILGDESVPKNLVPGSITLSCDVLFGELAPLTPEPETPRIFIPPNLRHRLAAA